LKNLLKNEKSPYLRQHENNPVYWYSWNKKTLEKARLNKKPIFLSVGYASCHWCHVMAHESFEDQDTAKIMNEKFINIKVDREERPDLDFIFQRSLSLLTGTPGGWPLSMFLDENAVPFTGGTYFPPKEIYGRPDFKKVLTNVADTYKENREKIITQAPQMLKVFKELNKKSAVIDQELEPFVEKILTHVDKINGGVKGAPKFPHFYMFDAMFYFFLKSNKQEYLKPVESLLFNLSSNGIYDQIAGGISRYTVDEKWIIPHFEKMLYDNIQYVDLLSKYIQFNNDNYFIKKLKQTIKFIDIEFKNSENLYGSAYDADSDGVEGKYYTWKYEELKSLFKEDLNIFKKKYTISEQGNFKGSNILIENKNFILSSEEEEKIDLFEDILIKERSKRNKPLFDDKTQTDLNAFWIHSLLQASVILNDSSLKNKTLDMALNLKNKLSNKIYHCYHNNEVDVFLEDYTYYCLMLISLYEIEGENENLILADKLMIKTWKLFFDKKTELLQKNIIDNNDLFANPIDINDNNIPNGNSIYLYLCNKLYTTTNDKAWLEKIQILKKSFHSLINSNFSQMFSFIKTLDICENIISFTFYGNKDDISNIINNLQKRFFGRATFIYKINKKEKGSIVICKDQTCSNKINNYEEIEKFFLINVIN
jgi:uncharacterized protein